MTQNKTKVYTFWYNPTTDNTIDAITYASIKSANSIDTVDFAIYTYGELKPGLGMDISDVKVLDANTIMERDKWFSVDYGPLHGFAFFANMFRYQLLYQHGGWWIDTDIILLADPSRDILDTTRIAYAHERTSSKGLRRMNNAYLYSAEPGHEFFKDAIESTQKVFDELERGADVPQWGTVGPLLITKLHDKYKHHKDVQELSKNTIYFTSYFNQDHDRWAYNELENCDKEVLGHLLYKRITGAHLWYSGLDVNRIHVKSYYSQLCMHAMSGTLPEYIHSIIKYASEQ